MSWKLLQRGGKRCGETKKRVLKEETVPKGCIDS